MSESETNKLVDVVKRAVNDFTQESLPECERNKKGYIVIVNKSSNPYEIYSGDKFLETLPGGYQKKYTVNMGTYSFRATQQSGFLMYPTVNNRTTTITEYCQEVVLKIGFADN